MDAHCRSDPHPLDRDKIMSKKSAKKKLNLHHLLLDYRDREDYALMARAAAQAVGAGEVEATAEAISAWAVARFGPPPPKLTMRRNAAPLALFGEVGTHIPPNALDQMYTVLRLPVATRGALMPDGHYGYAMPIGGVAALDRAVSPSFVGFDISCMMHLTVFDLAPEDFQRDREYLADTLVAETSFGLGASFGTPREHEVMDDPDWQTTSTLRQLRAVARSQLGSSGGGNHFCNLMLMEPLEPLEGLMPGQQYVALLSHSGSRGTGHRLATHYLKVAEQESRAVAKGIPKGYEWLSTESEAGQEYLAAMALVGKYALANHQLIHRHFAQAAGLTPRFTLWNRHNYAWLDEETGEVIHRKGATPAERGVLGIIPGSSGTASYVVEGLGNEESIFSSSHGAGRFFSRSEARRRHDEAAFRSHMAREDILHRGLAPDETLQAYKDIEMVMDVQDGVLVRRLAKLTPRVVLMGGASDDGD